MPTILRGARRLTQDAFVQVTRSCEGDRHECERPTGADS